jgi:ligand-binding SRPBCC domain-containing protein
MALRGIIATKTFLLCYTFMSKVYSIHTEQFIPISLAEAWDFFSSPANLAKITPAKMGFNIISKHHGSKMYPGQIIEYTVKPILGIPLYWMTEITHVQEGAYFVDEQRFGPYTMWHHQHHFTAVPGGVKMDDIVHYKIPLGFLGDIAQVILVKKQLQGIFDFRFQAVAEKWCTYKP